MNNKGWICLYRALAYDKLHFDNWSHEQVVMWLVILQESNYEDDLPVEGLKKGQALIWNRELAKMAVTTESKALTFLKKLVKENAVHKGAIGGVEDNTSNHTRFKQKKVVLTVCNYSHFQRHHTEVNTDLNTEVNNPFNKETNKQINNIDKSDLDFEEFWKKYPRTMKKSETLGAWDKLSDQQKKNAVFYIDAYKKSSPQHFYGSVNYLENEVWKQFAGRKFM